MRPLIDSRTPRALHDRRSAANPLGVRRRRRPPACCLLAFVGVAETQTRRVVLPHKLICYYDKQALTT